MPNAFELMKDFFEPFMDGEKKPLNVGEVMNLWFYLKGSEETLRNEQVAFNVVEDEELRKHFEDVINNVHKPIIEEIKEFLTKESVPLPETTPDIPLGDFRSVPIGAKLSDEAFCNLLEYNIILGINYAVRGLTESVRADVGLMFSKFQMRKVAFSISLKELSIKRGWIKIPPYYKS